MEVDSKIKLILSGNKILIFEKRQRLWNFSRLYVKMGYIHSKM